MTVRYHSLGPFEVLSRLGSGGMADVFKAWDSRDGRLVALKVPKADAGVREAERAGALVQQQLSQLDRRVPAVYEIHDHDGDEMYIAMEYVPGEDLADRIHRGPLEPREAVRIAIELCELLGNAQCVTGDAGGRARHGIVHGDLKPRNVRLTPDGAVKVLDFGIAKALSLTRALTRNEFGSLPYSSPERIESGNVDARSDVWSVSVVLYEMLTGRQPFRGESTRRLEDFIRSRARPEALPDPCPEPLGAVLRKALAPALERRYASAVALRDDLQAFLDGRPTAAEQESRVAAAYEATRRTTPSSNGGTDVDATRRTVTPGALPAVPGAAPAVSDAAPGAPAHDPDATRATLGAGGATARTLTPAEATAGANAPAAADAAANPAIPAPATAAPRRRFRVRWRLILLLAAIGLMMNEAQVMSAAGEFKRALPGIPRGESESVWKRYRELGARSLLGFGTLGLGSSVKDWFVSSADELIADYRSDTPVIREAGWRSATAMLGHAASIAPGDRAIRARLLYCRGHLARINAVAARERGGPDAQRYFNDATNAFEEAARLRPHWLDPQLGLARTYVYGLADPERAREALSRAEEDGYEIRDREMALIGDGYRLRAERTWSHAADFRDQSHEDQYMQSVREDCEQALRYYETIPAYGDVSRSIRKVQDLVDQLDAREDERRNVKLRKVGLGFLAPLFNKSR